MALFSIHPFNLYPMQKLTQRQIQALREAYLSGNWSGYTGKSSKRKPVSDTPIFKALEESKQTALCFK
jgi:hypothetical protein